MIITLTLNPAIDKTLTLENFDPHKMNRSVAITQDPGGKGINVSKVIKALDGHTVAMGIVGGSTGNSILASLQHEGIHTDFVQIAEDTRTNLKIFSKDNQETIEINEAGPKIQEEALGQLKNKLFETLQPGAICVLAGSVPQGIATSIYKDLIVELKHLGAIVILDADGELFRNGLLGKPDFIKPNLKELEAYFGKTIATEEDLKNCGQKFMEMGIKNVIFSLGSEGAFFMNHGGAYKACPLKVEAHSSVGAGDAFVGALAYALESQMSIEDTLKLAIATSAGAVTTVGTKPAQLDWVNAHKNDVVVQKLI